MSFSITRDQRRQLVRDNAKQPTTLQEVPDNGMQNRPVHMLRVLRSRDFFVQEFAESAPIDVRLSICRTDVIGDRWKEGITWDELQRLKRECGYGDRDAVEVFPADIDVVNVANMRHLWVMVDAIPYAWRK